MPPGPPADDPRTGRPLLPALALLAIAIAGAYANALSAGFQFDDWSVVVGDSRVASLRAWWSSMPGIRPLLKLTYAANHAAGAGPRGFHAVNVAVHAAAVLVLLALFRRMAGRLGADPARARLIAFAAALVFALHPVQTEAVTYVAGRSTALASALALGSVLAWVEGRERGLGWLSQLISPALFALALLVKETAIVVPAAILLCGAAGRRARSTWTEAVAAIPGHLVVLLAAATAAAASPTYRALASTSFATRGVSANLATQSTAVVYLAGQLVRFDRLNADPMLPPLAAWTIPAGFEALILLAVAAAGVLGLRRRPALAFGILWFFVWLAPTNSIVPRLDVVGDRQLYLALAGPAWLLGWGLSARPLPRRVALTIVAAGAVLLAGATRARNRVYADEISYWTDVVDKTPGNGRAWNNLGYAFGLAGRDKEAETAFTRALAIDPDDARPAVNLRLLREGALVPRGEPSP